jgi:hypothetical protein
LPVNTCVVAHCRAHAECAAHPGGACTPIEDPCCSGVYTIFCVYPGGCTKDSDCPQGYCVGDPATGAASCTPEKPACPI